MQATMTREVHGADHVHQLVLDLGKQARSHLLSAHPQLKGRHAE